MKNKVMKLVLMLAVYGLVLTGCGSSKETATEEAVTEEVVAEEAVVEEEPTEEEKAAEAAVYYEDGRSYFYGINDKERDFQVAYDNFQKAVELGHVDANYYLGVLNYDYGFPKLDYEVAKAYFDACPENPYAQIMLGFMYKNGRPVEKDVEKAREMFQTVVDNGYVEGYYGLAKIFKDEKDYATMYEYYEKVLEATEQGFISAATNDIGYMYANGEGVEEDKDLAMEWYEKGAALGNVSSMNNIAHHYAFVLEEPDYVKAMEEYQKAAALGSGAAMHSIGYLYQNGYGVEVDHDKAMEWFLKAAEVDYAHGIMWIGYTYYQGIGVEPDYAKALEWFKKAEELENAEAINQIGLMYCDGSAGEVNYEKAIEYFDKAAELDFEVAAQNAAAVREMIQ